MKNLLSLFVNFIYKKKCYFCLQSQENSVMCSKCYSKVEFSKYYSDRMILDTIVYCACSYKDIVQTLIRGIKYHNKKELAYFQAKIMYDYWNHFNKFGNYTVIPVPLSKERLSQRTYNQVELVAKEFCKMTGYKLNTKLLSRIKDTKPQYKLTKSQRMENLKDAFRVNKEAYDGSKLLVIDDVCTTGATFESIISELKKSGIKNITCFATATPKMD